MAFETPAPDLAKLVAAWEEFERGEETPGKVLSKLKTAGLPAVLAELQQAGWTPSVTTG
ncbi:MAG: hypothetical protein KDB40_13925 [Acidimicrobiales bacterium]|nr:hypothetical protein [Acidimicrobiales bacterium]MCB9392429.1 hypothetical protein [Acidimicrobiaceae bacterium]